MKIFDDILEKNINKVSLILTEDEIMQLKSYLKCFLNKSKDDGLHFHLSSENLQKEITVCIYNPKNLNALHPKIQKFIKENE